MMDDHVYRKTNYIDDIEGAHPAKRWTRTNRPNLYSTHDIEGAQPRHRRNWHWNNKPDGMTTLDIDNAQPKIKAFRTKRVVDPLNPEYELATFKWSCEPEPKFFRDSFDVSDIEGTKTMERRQRRYPIDPLAVDDIKGAKPKIHVHLNQEERDSFNVHDIVQKKKFTTRITDPQTPQYFMNCMHISDDPLCRPRAATSLPGKRRQSKVHDSSLYTLDIKGAQADTISSLEAIKSRATYIPEAVEGATADTLKRGIVSKRTPTNPLDPVYKGLDGNTVRATTAPHGKQRHFHQDYLVEEKEAENKSSILTPSARSGRKSLATSGSTVIHGISAPKGDSESGERQSTRNGHSQRLTGRSACNTASAPLLVSSRLHVEQYDSDVSIQKRPVAILVPTISESGQTIIPNKASPVGEAGVVHATKANQWKSTNRSSPLHKFPHGGGGGAVPKAVRFQNNLDRKAVLNLPDTLSSTSFMFPNKLK